ncbi:MAG: amidohydrolase, partial [Candidatus Brocadiae bacterium]|nr:amidohydrolase [Candidatus Brocadiia bacterium]
MIVDVHVHALPHRGQDALPEVVRQSRINGLSLALVSIGGSISQYPDQDEVRRCNDEARDFTERSPGLCRWLAYLSPQNANWRDELERCIEGGAIGVKLWTAFKDADGSMDNAVELVREAGARGLPLLIHTFQKSAGNFPGEITIPEFAMLAEACPDAQMVGAHAGGNWRHSIGVLRDRAPNAHLDVSGYFPERGLVEALVRDIGAERVLFGSDLAGRTLASQLAKVVFADIAEEEKELILWKNAARLFDLEDIPAAPSAPLRPVEELPDFKTEHFCFCGRWPFYEGPWVEPPELDELLGEAGIELAYTGDFDTLYRQDLEWANNRFLAAVRGTRRIAPLATVNPRAHNWRSVIRHLKDGFAGAILFPYMHNWRLDDPEHAEFFRTLAKREVPVWINCFLSDDRARHSGLACRPVAPDEAAAFCGGAPENRYVFQGLPGHYMAQILS